ncbi:MAG: hypothetical protein U0R80_01650 [Nocardioidaceae bacterium]
MGSGSARAQLAEPVERLGHHGGERAPASSLVTRELLGWTPSHPTLLEDLRSGAYTS